jgi:hypothetical protein
VALAERIDKSAFRRWNVGQLLGQVPISRETGQVPGSLSSGFHFDDYGVYQALQKGEPIEAGTTAIHSGFQKLERRER